MPLTAYSNKHQGEYDVDQLLDLMDGGQPRGNEVRHIQEHHRRAIAETVVCVGCGVGNPSVVSAGQSRSGSKRTVNQAHFRFDAHKPFCEFEFDPNPKGLADHLVDFRSTKSAFTRLVAERVSKGIELKMFSQATMREMRQWFLDLRIKHSYRCEIDPAFVDELFKLPYMLHSNMPAYTPAMSRIPGFKPNEFSDNRFIAENQDIYDVLKRPGALYFLRKNKSLIDSAVKRFQGTMIFDPSVAERDYGQVRELLHFIAAQEHSLKLPSGFFHNERNPQYSHMSAFCALLLFSNDGDMERAIDCYARIRTSGPATDPLAGNIIGLNPFYDHGLWSFFKVAEKVRKIRPQGLSVGDRIGAIRSGMSPTS